MILQIDMGNTALKWRLLQEDQCVARGHLSNSRNLAELDGDLKSYYKLVIRILVASVVSSEAKQALRKWAIECFEIEPEFAQSSAKAGAVINAYDDPEKLGVDRWLAVIAAYGQIKGACVVVSLGTALTIDAVSSEGMHLGGFIVPGKNAYVSALNQKTAQIDLPLSVEGTAFTLGKSTQSAVGNGYSVVLKSLIDHSFTELNKYDPGAKLHLVIAGGDASLIKSIYPQGIVIDELVLDGLSHIFGVNPAGRVN